MKSLYEGLLDGDIFDNIDSTLATDWLKDNVKSQYKVTQLKTGELKIRGKLIIDGVAEIGWLNIVSLKGDLYIENCDIVDLDRIFAQNAKVNGGIYITGCKKLTDISGLPRFVEGDVVITNCPALRELTDVNCWAENVSIMRCGKRFKQGAVQKAFPTAVRIVCSEEEYEANLNEAIVNEAFQDPVLIRLYDQIRNLKKKFNISDMFGEGIRPDKITPSMRETFTLNDEKKMLTAARKALRNRHYSENLGFIATEDHDGNFVMLANSDLFAYWLKDGDFPLAWSGFGGKASFNFNQLISMLNPSSLLMEDVKYVHIWSIKPDRWVIRRERQDAKRGMIDVHNITMMRTLRYEQQMRYAKALKALKAVRNSDKYKEILAKVDSIMQRFNKFMNKLIDDPSWAASVSYDAEEVFKSIRSGYERGVVTAGNRCGVIYAFQKWSYSIAATVAKKSIYGEIDDSDLLKAISWADIVLSKVKM